MGGSGKYHPPVKSWTGVSTWRAHTNRSTPSIEPGTDFYCPRFTDLFAAASGRVADVSWSIVPATGRYITLDLDDGRRVRYLHLEDIYVGVGQRVAFGQVIGRTGATGYGERDWSWNVAQTGGAHVHMTLWAQQRYTFGRYATLDPQEFIGDLEPVKTPEQIEEEELMGAKDDILSGVRSQVERVLSAIRREERWRKVQDTQGRFALARQGSVIALESGEAAAAEQMRRISEANPLLLPPEEVAGVPVKLDPTAFFTYIDEMNDPEHGFGRFVKNTFELTGGDTVMVRSNGEFPYAHRGLVWQNARPVEITLGGVVVRRFVLRDGVRFAELVDGRLVPLTDAQVARADAQRPAGQTWGS